MLTNFLFPTESFIRHKKTGGIYQVKITPDVGRLEATNTPAYAYRSYETGLVWFRERAEVEDGRFELCDEVYIMPLNLSN